MPILYFAKDGSYGDAKNLITITTTNWDSHMMNSIKNVPDESRASFAQALRNNVHDLEPDNKSKLGCTVCTDLFAAL